MSKTRLLTRVILLASTIGVIFSVSPVQAGSTIHFDGLLWTLFQQGVGPRIHHTHVVIPDTSFSSANLFYAGLVSVCSLRGDFDVQVSFKLPVWPPASGVRVELSAPNGGVGVDRFSASSTDFVPPGEYYFFSGQAVVSTSDLSGGLRLVRTGGSATGYYLSGAAWVPIGGTTTSTSLDTRFIVSAITRDSFFAHVDVKVTFRDFIINSGTLVCP